MKYCKKCDCDTERFNSGRCKPCLYTYRDHWRKNNKEKQKSTDAAYRKAHPERMRAATAKWRASNVEKANAYTRQYYAANTEKCLAATARWGLSNPDKKKHCEYVWRVNNPDACRMKNANYRARISSGGNLSKGLGGKLYEAQKGKCACGCKQPLGSDYHLDHRMPLALGGSNTDDNMQLLRAKCNLQKGAKHPVDFMRQRGFLL